MSILIILAYFTFSVQKLNEIVNINIFSLESKNFDDNNFKLKYHQPCENFSFNDSTKLCDLNTQNSENDGNEDLQGIFPLQIDVKETLTCK